MLPQRSQRYPFVSRPGSGAPLEVARTEGAYLITPDGRRILDAAGGAIVVNVGHGRREVAEAYARGATEVSYLVPPFASEERVQLVERLVDRWAPAGLTRVGFASGGSEGMDAAIRIARHHQVAAGHPRRWQVLGRELSYHGTTIATLAIGGHLKRRTPFDPWLPPFERAKACYCYRCPFEQTYPECGVACAEDVVATIERAGPENVAAFVVEPIVGSNAGALVPPDEYLPRIAEICREYGILLIADEVMTGFGRTGRRFGVDHWDVVPDILVGGKGLTSGYAPMAAILATEAVVAPIAERGEELMFFTYSAAAGACAVANTVLDILEREKLVERAAEMGEKLRARLASLEDHPHVGDIRGRGLLLAVELVADKETREPFPKEAGLTNKVMAAGLAEGTFFYPGGNDPARDVMVLGPPFIIGDEEVELMGATLERAIDSAVARVHEHGTAG